MTTEGISRRHALAGAATVGIGVPLLAACGGGEPEAASESSGGPTINCSCHGSKFSAVDGSVVHGPATSPLGAASVSVKGQDIEVDGQVLAQSSDIPEGGGAIFPDEEIVVTQPEPGEFKAFTAVCTHQKCLVTSVTPG
jgi:nitrite reductase/ring-hydroxylating ferredoxin subunit